MPAETITGAPNTAASGDQANSAGQQAAGSAATNTATQQPADQQKQTAQPQSKDGAGDQKPAGEQKSDTDGKAKAPEKYELKLPDGAKLDPKHLDAVAEYAKTLGLNQEQAQALVERDAALVESHQKGIVEAHAKTVQEWHRQVAEDKELGGSNFDATREAARRAITRFGDDEFRKALNDTGYGNWPPLVRFVAKIGRAMAEDKFVNANNPAAGKKTAESILYGSGS